MVFSQSQYFDVVQYAETMGLDPKIFSHEIIRIKNSRLFWDLMRNVKLKNSFSIFRVKETSYFFSVQVKYNNFSSFNTNSLNFNPVYWLGAEGDDSSEYDIEAQIKMSPAINMLETIYIARGKRATLRWDCMFTWGKIWVNNLVNEMHAIKSLERINSIPSFFADSRPYGEFGGMFSQVESVVIKEKINLLKGAIIEEIPLNDVQFKIINEKLDDLRDQVNKVNKFDFKTLFFGILTNLTSSVLYDSAPEFWKIFRNIFNNISIGDGGADLLL